MGTWKRLWEEDGSARSSTASVMELDTDGVFINDDPLRRISPGNGNGGKQDRPVTKKITLVTKRRVAISTSSSGSGDPNAQLNAADMMGICSC